MGLMAGALWLFNLAVVLGGYAALLALLSYGVGKHAGAKGLVPTSVAALVLGLLVASFLLDAFISGLPVKKLYIFTAFSQITWRPVMLWLAVAAALLYTAAYRVRRHKVAFLGFAFTALACGYAGAAQAVAGLFFGNDILRAHGIELQY